MKTLKNNYETGDVAYGRANARKIYLKEKWLDPDYKNLNVFEEAERDKFERTNTTNESFKPLIDQDVLHKLVKQEEPSEASKGKNFAMEALEFVTVDEFNYYGDFENIFDRSTDNADILKNETYIELDQQDNTTFGLRNYWKGLIASKYSPEKLPKISDEDAELEWKTLATKYPDIGLLSTKLDKSGLSDNRQKLKYLALRRACKFGIAHMTGTGKRVHFVLDGINMWDVAEKRPVEIGNEKPGVSITTSELRYVYRNWPAIKDKVFFYLHNREVFPPWDWDVVILFEGMASASNANPPTVKRMWEMYGERRLQKPSNNQNQKHPNKN